MFYKIVALSTLFLPTLIASDKVLFEFLNLSLIVFVYLSLSFLTITMARTKNFRLIKRSDFSAPSKRPPASVTAPTSIDHAMKKKKKNKRVDSVRTKKINATSPSDKKKKKKKKSKKNNQHGFL